MDDTAPSEKKKQFGVTANDELVTVTYEFGEGPARNTLR